MGENNMTENLLIPISEIPAILKKESVRKIFLVADQDAYRFSGAKESLESCLSEYEVTLFDGFELNPKLEDVIEGIKKFRGSPCDITIAIGGGSAIDVAKLVASFAAQSEDPKDIICGEKEITSKGVPVIAVPTTAGTGSEATHFAVVYIDHVKYSVAHDYLLPDYFIVDPSLTMSLPALVTMSSGLDALCQGIESYWSVNSTEESRSYAKQSIRLAWKNLKETVLISSGANREAMCLASHLAGKGINISKTTAPHAFSYAITTYYHVPHGAAVALTLPEFFKFNSDVKDDDCQDSRGLQFVKNRISDLLEIMECHSVEEFINQFKLLQRSIHAPSSLNEVGVNTLDQLDSLIKQVNPERLANNPRQLSEGILKNLLRASIL